jgi:hypothetical protein
MSLSARVTLSIMLFIGAICVLNTNNVPLKIAIVGFQSGLLFAKFVAWFLKDEKTGTKN